MLMKLLKYDLLADYKKYCAVYIAMLAASVMILLSSNPFMESATSMGANVITLLVTSVFTMLSAAVAVMVLIFSISRFYKNLVRDEGYLMHTLPVPTWQLLLSKLIAVYIWTVATVIVEIICLSIGFHDLDFFEVIFDFFELLVNEGISIYLLYVVLAPFSLMSCIYFAFSLGNLFSRNKLAMSVVMYFAVKFAERMLNLVFTAAAYAGYNNGSSYYSSSSYESTTIARYVFTIALSVGYFIAAERIFSKKLNLE